MDVSRAQRTSRLLVSETARLTGAEPPELEAVRRRTWIGPASWASDTEHVCGDRAYWDGAGGKHSNSKWLRSCRKFLDLMGRRGRRVPAPAPVCKFFTASDEAKARQSLRDTF
jgi:hypothetical protein